MPSSPGRPRGDRHGWNSLDGYFNSHYGHMEHLAARGFLLSDELTVETQLSGNVLIYGRLRCRHGLTVFVRKTLQVVGNRVRTIDYNYHAAFADPHRQIFRYDMAHEHGGHRDPHHRHGFDPPGAPEPGRVTWVGYDRWPTLTDVVDELEEWWESTGQFLELRGLPESGPEPEFP